MPKKSTKIKEIAKLLNVNGKIIIEKISTNSLVELKNEMLNISDVRNQSYIKHNLIDIVMLVLIAILADANEWIEIEEFGKKKEKWLKKFLTLSSGIPSHDTIQRVFSKLNTKELHNTCINFLITKINELYNISRKISDEEIELEKDIRSIDGKCSNGSGRNMTYGDDIRAVQSLNMYSSDLGLCISQVFIEEKSNEIPASRNILNIVNIKDCIVTCDALNTQKKVIEKIAEKGGNYVCALKGNQHNFFKDVEDYFNDDDFITELKKDKQLYYKYSSKENSNIITREHYLMNNIEWLNKKEDWKNIKAVGLVKKSIIKPTGELIEEKRYYISSISDIEDFSRCTRGHWNVENKLHWHLDYTFKDDNNTTAEKESAKNLQIIKKIALGILNIVKPAYKASLKNIRKRLAWDFENEIENIFKLIKTDEIEKLLIK